MRGPLRVHSALVGCLCIGVVSCSSSPDALREGRGALRLVEQDRGWRDLQKDPADTPKQPAWSGRSVDEYTAASMRKNPALKAAYMRWKAEVEGLTGEDVLPNPVVSYGIFLRSVETRVGPQRHKVGVRQSVPWPSRRTSAVDRSAAQARALGQRFEALSLRVQRDVALSWWSLWELRALHHIDNEQLQLLHQLAQSLRTRLALGSKTVSDANRLDMTRVRLLDRMETLKSNEGALQTRLGALIGLPNPPTTLHTQEPELHIRIATEPEADLVRISTDHPALLERDARAQQYSAQARNARAQRAPNMTFGVDWIETGDVDPNMVPAIPSDSGKDPLIASVAVEVPLWREAYTAKETKARALRDAELFSKLDLTYKMKADANDAISRVRDSARRMRLLHNTLIPQAEIAYRALLGEYETGKADLDALFAALGDLIGVKRELVQAQAQHQRAWAILESVLGRSIPSRRENLKP